MSVGVLTALQEPLFSCEQLLSHALELSVDDADRHFEDI